MSEWSFYPQKATDPIRDPIAGEFFSTEAVGDAADALIREGVQNTLDARARRADDSREVARVRIYLSETAGACPPRKTHRWFDSLGPHLSSPKNGLQDAPARGESCPFLVFEDFGTIGLTGDPGEYEALEGVHNNFLNFFRAEGHSDKGQQDRGSWGVGKTVFPRSSRISSFFGLTRRAGDPYGLLLGRSILKCHRVGRTSYKSDGYFGVSRQDGLVLPCDDRATIDDFCADFNLQRNREPGLSIVVPWYDTDPENGISADRVVGAVLRGFFYSILKGDLSVAVATPGREVSLNNSSIMSQLRQAGGALAAEFSPLVELAAWAQASPQFCPLVAPPADRAQHWLPEAIPTETVGLVRALLQQRQRVALRVPMHVQSRSDGPRSTFFDVFMEQSQSETERPVFIRDELIIPDVRSARAPRVRALVIVEDEPLAGLLRDAETPAHTQWNAETGHFKNKYKFGPGAIRYVSQSVSEILRIINQADSEPDPTLTIDFFSLPRPADDEGVTSVTRAPKLKPGKKPQPPPFPVIPKSPRRFRIDTLKGGFAIKPGDPGASEIRCLRVRVAYDVRRGNPLRRFRVADIEPSALQIISNNDSAVVERSLCRDKLGLSMVVRLKSPDFHLEVTGFDLRRDLYVKADEKVDEREES